MAYRIVIPEGWDRKRNLRVIRLDTHIQISQEFGAFIDERMCRAAELIVIVPIERAYLIPKFITDWIEWSYNSNG